MIVAELYWECIAIFIGEYSGRLCLTLSHFFAKSSSVIVTVAAATSFAVLCITLRFGMDKFRQVRITSPFTLPVVDSWSPTYRPTFGAADFWSHLPISMSLYSLYRLDVNSHFLQRSAHSQHNPTSTSRQMVNSVMECLLCWMLLYSLTASSLLMKAHLLTTCLASDRMTVTHRRHYDVFASTASGTSWGHLVSVLSLVRPRLQWVLASTWLSSLHLPAQHSQPLHCFVTLSGVQHGLPKPTFSIVNIVHGSKNG